MKKFCILIAMFLSSTSMAALQVEGARFRPIPIALPEPKVNLPNAHSTQSALELIAVVRNDLALSGVFTVLDPKSYVADPAKEGLAKSTFRVEDWTQIGAEGLVKSLLTVNGDELSIEIAIHSLKSVKPSEQKSLKASLSQSKRLAHQISDAILTFFTGDPGIFNSQIVAAKEFKSGKKIVVLDFDGGNERIVTKGDGIHILPTWLPEGDAIFYTTWVNHNGNLMQVNLDGTGAKKISSRPDVNSGAQVSPDRSQIAFTIVKNGGSDIYLSDRSGNGLKQITSSFGIDISPFFSPDGKKIAFVSARSGNPQIYIMDSDGKNPTRQTFQGKYNQTPRFSPKGDYIVFTGRDERKVFDIFLLDVNTKVITRITQDQGNNEDPWFSPNGRLVVFTSTRDGNRELYLSSLDGNMQKRLTTGGGYWTPSWGPSK